MRDLVLTEEAAKARVLEALISGAVAAACYRMIRQPFAVHALGGAEEISDFTRISRSAWARGYTAQETLWETGTIKFASLGREGPFSAFDMPSECIHVRFEPIGIELLCEQLQAPKPKTPIQVSRAPPPIKPLEVSRAYNPRPVGTLDQIAPELAAYRNVPNNVPVTDAEAPTPKQYSGPWPYPVGPPEEAAPKTKARPKDRSGQRKAVAGLPYVPDDALTKWYEGYYAKNPEAVHRVVKGAATKRFQSRYRVGKNQLYDIMRAVQGKLRPGRR